MDIRIVAAFAPTPAGGMVIVLKNLSVTLTRTFTTPPTTYGETAPVFPLAVPGASVSPGTSVNSLRVAPTEALGSTGIGEVKYEVYDEVEVAPSVQPLVDIVIKFIATMYEPVVI